MSAPSPSFSVLNPNHGEPGKSLRTPLSVALGRVQLMQRRVRRGEIDPETLSASLDSVAVALQQVLVSVERVEDDADALELAKLAAEQANRVKSSFMSAMSHELRTPMNSIIGYLYLLLEGSEGDLTPAQIGDLQQISASADHLLILIDGILDLARIESGRMELNLELVDLESLIASIALSLAPIAARKGITLRVDLAPQQLRIPGDPLRLRQIFLNIIANAVKFTERGSVRVSARLIEDEVEVSISDTGAGIAAERLSSIFDEFQQSDAETTRRYGGSGLGLTIASHLAILHHGNVAVSSTVGVGSIFTVTLPAGDATSQRGRNTMPTSSGR